MIVRHCFRGTVFEDARVQLRFNLLINALIFNALCSYGFGFYLAIVCMATIRFRLTLYVRMDLV